VISAAGPKKGDHWDRQKVIWQHFCRTPVRSSLSKQGTKLVSQMAIRNAESIRPLSLIVLLCSIIMFFVGIWEFATPLAASSALVQAIEHAPSDRVYDVAYDSLAGIMRFFSYIYIILGILIGACSLGILRYCRPQRPNEQPMQSR
jgi:hypothetical protein